jgi:PAS domain S-box-containing protein
MVLLGLIQNLALLLSLSIAYQAILQLYPKKNDMYKLLSGILFGGIGIIAMMTPMTIGDAILIDGRAVILSMAGFMAGPVVALIASVLCIVYRLGLGGIGTSFGIWTICTSAAIGSGFYYLAQRRKSIFPIYIIWLFGLLVHGINLIPLFFLPANLKSEIISNVGIMYLFLYPCATVILYWILQSFESRIREREALKISEQRFQMASEASKIGVWHWDIVADQILWDEQCWRMLGYKPDAFPLTYKSWQQLIHPLDIKKVIEDVEASLLHKGSLFIEMRYRSASGEWIWTEGRGKVIYRDANKRPTQMTGIHLDINQRKEAIEALSQKDKIFTHSLDMLYIAGFDGYFKVLNPAWSHTLGWEISELLEQPWLNFVHPEDKVKTANVLTDIVEGESVIQFENRYLCKDGRYKWLSWNSHPYIRENIIIGVVRDVTEQKQIEETLRSSEVRYEQLFTGMIEAFALHEMIYDEQGHAVDYRFLDVNPAFERITGLKRDELIGQTVLTVLPGTEQYWLGNYAEVARSGVPIYYVNYSQPLEKWFSVNVYSPKTGQFVTTFSDITEQKTIEYQLKESLAKLELLFDLLPIGISILDEQQKIVSQNPALAEIYGLSREGMLLGEHRKREYFHRDGSPMPREEFVSSRIRRGEQEVKQVILGTKKEDESPLWLEVSGVACSFQDWHTILLTQDITERMKMEIENDFYQQKINRHSLDQETMLWLTVSLREAKTLIEAQEMVVNLIVDTYNVEMAVIFETDGKSLLSPVAAGIGFSAFVDSSERDFHLFQDVLETGRPRRLSSLQEIESALSKSIKIEPALVSCIILPIISGEMKLGVLLVGNHNCILPIDDLIVSLAAVAEIIAITLQRMGNLESMKQMISRRTMELSTLYNVIAVSDVQKVLSEKLEMSIAEVMQVLGCDYGGIFFLDENRNRLKMVAGTMGRIEIKQFIENSPLENLWEGRVIQQAEPVIIPNISDNPYYQSTSEYHEFPNHVFIGVPILLHGSVYGLVSVFREGPQIFNLDEITFLNALVNHIGVMIENHKLIEEAEQAGLKEERIRLARQMHDSVTQTLYSAVLFANAGQDLLQENKLEQLKEVLFRLSQLSKQALNEMRLMIFEMRPPDLEQDGLVTALRKRLEMVEKRASIQTKLSINQTIQLEPRIEEVLYWVVIEALNNITRHAHASEILVEFYVDSTALTLSIKDNGVGFDPMDENNLGGQGLANMRERMQKINGSLEIFSNNGRGTTIFVTLPYAFNQS